MKRHILSVGRSRFVRSVVAVAGGTAAAQAISVALSPLITRLYGPEAFGALGVFSASLAVLTPLAALGYWQAIAMPKNDKDAVQIGLLSLKLSLGVALAILPIAVLFRRSLALALGFETMSGYLWLLAPALLAVGCEQVLMQWIIRKGRFRGLGFAQGGQALLVGVAKTSFGLIHPGPGTLILIQMLGRIVNPLLLLAAARGTVDQEVLQSEAFSNGHRQRELAAEYRDFPLYRAPQLLLNSVSRSLPLLLFASLFGPAVAGYYAIGQRVLQLPVILVSQAVGKVLLPRLAEAVRSKRSMRPLVLKTTAGLAVFGIVPFALVFAMGPRLFAFVFGPGWAEAGLYARWLVPWLFLGFLNVPSVQSLPFSQSQGFLLVWEIIASTARVAVIVGGALLLKDVLLTIKVYSLLGATMYVLLIVEGYRRAGIAVRARQL